MATFKISLDKVVVTSVEVDIPDACPSCGESLLEPGALEEQQLCFGDQICTLAITDTKDGTAYADDHDTTESGDCAYVTGYRCNNCHEEVAEAAIEEEVG